MKVNNVLFWQRVTFFGWQCLPPLLLLPIAWIRPDFTSSVLWLVVLAVLVFCSIKLAIATFRFALFFMMPSIKPYNPLLLVRTALSLIIALLLTQSVSWSLKSANNEYQSLFYEIEALCLAQQLCPNDLSNWQGDGRVVEVGQLAKFMVLYRPAENRQRFSLILIINIDQQERLTGGL